MVRQDAYWADNGPLYILAECWLGSGSDATEYNTWWRAKLSAIHPELYTVTLVITTVFVLKEVVIKMNLLLYRIPIE